MTFILSNRGRIDQSRPTGQESGGCRPAAAHDDPQVTSPQVGSGLAHVVRSRAVPSDPWPEQLEHALGVLADLTNEETGDRANHAQRDRLSEAIRARSAHIRCAGGRIVRCTSATLVKEYGERRLDEDFNTTGRSGDGLRPGDCDGSHPQRRNTHHIERRNTHHIDGGAARRAAPHSRSSLTSSRGHGGCRGCAGDQRVTDPVNLRCHRTSYVGVGRTAGPRRRRSAPP